MELTSKTFSANGLIPAPYTCDGNDTSPSLLWDNLPTEARSLALIVDDPDAPNYTFIHWVVYDIPTQIRQFPEGISTQREMLSGGGTQGINDFGNLGYGGPCPPNGTHRYFFKLYALDRVLGLDSGATKAQLQAAMSGHVLKATELVGRYGR
jgi:Raf kinase inhibitor-like YbhB/YbcL family protein